MKKILFVFTIAAAYLTTQNSSATLLAGWDFAGLAAAPNTPAILPSTVGSASIDISTFASTASNPERTAFAGSTLNLFTGGDQTAGQALALANSAANGESMIFSLSMLGYESLSISFAVRGTGTGFNTHVWSWSTDGSVYTALAGNNTADTTAAFLLKSVDFSSVLDLNNASTAYLKLTVSGASQSAGNNRFDNIQLNATPLSVPEPSPMALVGGFGMLALVMAARRRNG